MKTNFFFRNLSYRAQEVEDPNYDKRQVSSYSRSHCDIITAIIRVATPPYHINSYGLRNNFRMPYVRLSKC